MATGPKDVPAKGPVEIGILAVDRAGEAIPEVGLDETVILRVDHVEAVILGGDLDEMATPRVDTPGPAAPAHHGVGTDPSEVAIPRADRVVPLGAADIVTAEVATPRRVPIVGEAIRP